MIKTPQDRLDELRFMRIHKQPRQTGKGAPSLKLITQNGKYCPMIDFQSAYCVVIKHNAARIWDVGELEYHLVAFMLNEVPMEQLAEIEGNSPVGCINSCWYID